MLEKGLFHMSMRQNKIKGYHRMSGLRPGIRRVFLMTIIVMCSGLNLFAQQNLLYVDDRPFHFGFSIGINMMNFSVKESGMEVGTDSVVYHAGVRGLKPGLSVGLITDLRLNRYWNLRCTPTLHFGERTMSYKHYDGAKGDPIDLKTSIVSLPLTLPVYVKYSAERHKNYRPYVIAGGGMYYDLGRDKEKDLLLKPIDFFVEAGLGCDIYLPFFKFCPEIKYAIGFNDVLTPSSSRNELVHPEQKKFTDAISRLRSQMITLTFNFE